MRDGRSLEQREHILGRTAERGAVALDDDRTLDQDRVSRHGRDELVPRHGFVGQVQLADIEVLDPQSVCIDIAGLAWPCGVIARTAFRNFLRGRAMSCVVPDGRWTETVVSQCLVGNQDPAAWLVSRGWARALPETQYVALEDMAREGARGVYGSDPRNLSAVIDSGVQVPQQPDAATAPAPPPAPLE